MSHFDTTKQEGLKSSPACAVLLSATPPFAREMVALQPDTHSQPTPTAEEALVTLMDALTAIMESGHLDDLAAAYKTTHQFIARLGEIKQAAIQQAEAALREQGLAHYRSPYGTLGWTTPNPEPSPKLDTKRLLAASESDPALAHAIAPYLQPGNPGKPQFYCR